MPHKPTMQDWPLLVSKLIDHAGTVYAHRPVVTNSVEGGIDRSDWAAVRKRALRVARCLDRLGIKRGDRIATLAWNTARHVECWYGISGLGAIAHTINPRLFPEQIRYIVNHAEDRILFLDLSFVPLIEGLAAELPSIERYVLLTDSAHIPESHLDFVCYEDWLSEQDDDFAWPLFDERTPAGLCYTSGTTGNPKGVLYTHRSNVLHAFACAQADAFGLSARAAVLPVVPMFHANAWGIPYGAALTGAALVLNGPAHDAATLHRLIAEEGVTVAAAVPTIWLGMLSHLESNGLALKPLERIVIGGAAAPRSMIEQFELKHGVTVCHMWGSTEISPIGTVGMLCGDALALEPSQRIDLQCKQGRPPFGVEMKVTGDDRDELPRDGRSFGHLKVRGPWVVERYYDAPEKVTDDEGWFDTGDIATLDEQGYMQITDRAKDVIKSGGEWISSIELENAAIGCRGVAEAAVIGLPHPKWDERPLLVVVRQAGSNIDAPAILAHLASRVARWWLPDEIMFVDELPHSATGKILKLELRKQFAGHRLATIEEPLPPGG